MEEKEIDKYLESFSDEDSMGYISLSFSVVLDEEFSA